MTDEEIKKLAKEYAESGCNPDDYDDKEQRDNDRRVEYDFALPVLQWLNHDYCIVSKDEVLKMKNHANVLRSCGDYRRFNADIIDETLSDLFGEELFQETSKNSMITFENSKGNEIKIFGDICEDEAMAQIKKLADFEPYLDSHIRIMPDVHAGKGCTVGTTMILDNAVTPNITGVDIGCGMFVVPLGKVDIDLAKFDKVVNEKIPCGFNIHDEKQRTFQKLNDLYCRLSIDLDMAQRSIGSLGGGNHFIELDIDDSGNKYLVIHSGSRNLGVRVCGYYQRIAKENCDPKREKRAQIIAVLKAQGREKEIQATLKTMRYKVDKDLAYLQGADMCRYLHDMIIVQNYAKLNRETIAGLILVEFPDIIEKADERPFHTIHNYIEIEAGCKPMLRKGAVSAYLGERLIIPMNMRDGSLLCVGKGNPDWNCSAPHGAGRLMSRKKAKETLSMADFEDSMHGVYSTSVCESTIDEAPQAYKPMQSIIDAIGGTVIIEKIIRPIYNFKSKQ